MGIILTVLPFIEKLPRVKKWLQIKAAFVDRLILTVGIACIVWGFYAAWHTERDKRIAAETKLAELTTPKLSARVNFYLRGYSPEINSVQVWLNVAIKNDGSPSVACCYSLRVRSKGEIRKIHPTRINNGFELKDAKGKVLAKFNASDRLEDKTSIAAIQRGLPVAGWLRFVLPGMTTAQFGDAEKTLYFNDVNDKEYSVSFVHLGERLSAPVYIPGSGDNPFTKDATKPQ